jgi:hypothetical protein
LDSPEKESVGKTGIGLYPEAMVEHDGHVGLLLRKLDDLKNADTTIAFHFVLFIIPVKRIILSKSK